MGQNMCKVEGCASRAVARGYCHRCYYREKRYGTFRANVIPQSLRERYEAKVDRSGGPDACHAWTGNRNKHGYGWFIADGIRVRAHRWAYIQANGPIDDGIVVRHTCDNPPCQNLRHLLAGTPADNTNDMMARGRCGRRLPESVISEILSSRETGIDLARRLGIADSTISEYRRGNRWRESS